MKKIIFLWIFLMTFQVIAQQKGAAVKFDEFSDFPAERVSPLYDRTTRFGEKMKRALPGQQAVIIYYNQRKGAFPLKGGSDWAKSAAETLSYFYGPYKISEDRIIIIDGGYREYRTLEFWIVSKDAEMPKPVPAFSKDEVIYCPEINIAGDGFRQDRKQPLEFSAAIRGAATEQSFPLEWSVSAGKIVSGQGINQIKVDLSETDANKITAAVIVKGLPPECDCHAYHSTAVGFYPYKIDAFSYLPYSMMAERIDNFFIQLFNEPTMTGYIYIYGGREGQKKNTTSAIRNIRQIIAFRKYDPSRIKIIEGGFREEMEVEFYLVPPGSDPPKPTPTLNADFVNEPPKKVIKRTRAHR